MRIDAKLDVLLQAEKEAGPVDPEEENVGSWFSNPAGSAAATNGSGVGKYLNSIPKKPAAITADAQLALDSSVAPMTKRQKVKQTGYGNFDAW